jgi:hypothetical protein
VTFEAFSKKNLSVCRAHLMSRCQPAWTSSKTAKSPQNVFMDFVYFPEMH